MPRVGRQSYERKSVFVVQGRSRGRGTRCSDFIITTARTRVVSTRMSTDVRRTTTACAIPILRAKRIDDGMASNKRRRQIPSDYPQARRGPQLARPRHGRRAMNPSWSFLDCVDPFTDLPDLRPRNLSHQRRFSAVTLSQRPCPRLLTANAVAAQWALIAEMGHLRSF